MTDKFVVSTNEIGEIIVTDVETDRVYRYDDPSNFFGLIRLLNEQQSTITHLEKVNGKNFAKRRLLEQDNLVLRNENEQLRKQCFELEKDYVIETSDISDKIYLDDEIKELKQKYGVKDE